MTVLKAEKEFARHREVPFDHVKGNLAHRLPDYKSIGCGKFVFVLGYEVENHGVGGVLLLLRLRLRILHFGNKLKNKL